MRDLRGDITNVWRFASRLAPPVGEGRSIMFIAARSGEGTSSIAASFALIAARQAEKATWLVDLDFHRNGAIAAFQNGFADDVGRPGRVFDASLRQEQIYALGAPHEQRDARLLTVRQIEREKLLVTKFRVEQLQEADQVRYRTSPSWWRALRKASDWTIVDAPALERSPAGLAMASQQDGVILVVEADHTSPEQLAIAQREIITHGGSVLGAVINKVGGETRFIERLGL